MKLFPLVAPLLLLAAATAPLSAGAVTTIYAADFEFPTFSLGNLSGQNGWYQDIGAFSSFSVQNAVVSGGSQALAISSTGQPNFTRTFQFISYTPSTSAEKTLELSLDFRISSAATHSQQRMTFFNGSLNAVFDLIVLADGRLSVFDETSSTNTISVGAVARNDTWHSLDAFFDFNTRRVSVFYDNTAILSQVQFQAAAFTGSLGAFALQELPSGGTDTMYVDNLVLRSTTAVPEPGSAALMLAGLLGVAGLQRRRRS